MLTIRLSRTGKRNKPMYRVVISEKSRTPKSKALEILGHYDPYNKNLQVKEERVKYWMDKGAQSSPRVHNLFIDNKIIEGEKLKASKAGKKKKEEAQPKEEAKKTEEKGTEEQKEEDKSPAEEKR